MRLAIGLGGHALPQCTASDEAWLAVARAIAPLLSEHRVFITHGNGPQVGNLAESESAVGLDQATAATAGWIGYRLERALRSSVPQARVATLLTLALVGSSQPESLKPIGRIVAPSEMATLAARGWTFSATGDGVRRVVASPRPERIFDIEVIAKLMTEGVVVVCGGGGGVPVRRRSATELAGVEGVIDKDLTTSLLASSLGVDRLLLLTDVTSVAASWPAGGDTRHFRVAPPDFLSTRKFAPGSMAPKIAAACDFVSATGGLAHIGSIAEAVAVLRGERGTTIGAGALSYY